MSDAANWRWAFRVSQISIISPIILVISHFERATSPAIRSLNPFPAGFSSGGAHPSTADPVPGAGSGAGRRRPHCRQRPEPAQHRDSGSQPAHAGPEGDLDPLQNVGRPCLVRVVSVGRPFLVRVVSVLRRSQFMFSSSCSVVQRDLF